MIREEQLNDNNILEMLKSDPIGRNQQLNTFLGLLNSIQKNSILTIDGDWGSGKTVFVKQIDYLSRMSATQTQSLDQSVMKSFQDSYDVYYFNAWENDYHEDPLQSILFSLINDLWGARERVSDKTVKFSKALLNSVLKVTTVGMYDAEEIRRVESISDLTKNITTASERKKAVDDIISNYLELTGKKLLFVIDELDRCRPTYAVNLLEVMKHYYTNDKLVFLLSTNNRQLSHTIKKVYGQSFDGAGYLNKFYDLIFNLPSVKPEMYVKYLGYAPGNGHWSDTAPLEVIACLGLSIRQINRYYSSLKLIEYYYNDNESSGSYIERQLPAQLVKFALIPLAYGLRIKDFEDYTRFVNGDGVDILKMFHKKSNVLSSILEQSVVRGEVSNPESMLEEVYHKICDDNLEYSREDYSIHRSAEVFKNTVLLMNASGTIDGNSKSSKE